MNAVWMRLLGVSVAMVAVSAAAGCASDNHGQTSGPGMMGNAGGYQYSRSTCSAPQQLPGQVLTVTLADMGMSRMMGGDAPTGAHMTLRAVPATITSGEVTFVVENMGWRTHELVILPLARGAVAGQRTPGSDGEIDESGSLGEASANCAAGSGDGIPSGAVSWLTVTLRPGSYELVCNLPNHYADGMRQQLTVTG